MVFIKDPPPFLSPHPPFTFLSPFSSSSSSIFFGSVFNMKSALFFFFITALLLCRAPTTLSVTCNPMELSPCAGAILSSAPPTAACCAKLKEQKPCFCQYKKNPKLQNYINSKNSKKVASTCGVPIPNC